MKKFIPAVLFFFLLSCNVKEKADLLVFNATIYTVDSAFTVVESMVINDGKIIATGKTAEMEEQFEFAEKLDAGGKFIYPGLIDAHAHFVGYGTSLQRVNLTGTTSWEEVIAKTKQFALENPDGWVLGRGWDQNDWSVKVFPDNSLLNEAFPDRPVLLTRVDGHAAMANDKALELAGIHAGDTLTGGKIEDHEGTLTGLLIDNAIGLVRSKIPETTEDQLKKSLKDAQANCFAMGLTTIDECGLSHTTVESIKKWQDSGEL